MYHDFWLFREGERLYPDYDDLLVRSDAPLRFDESIFFYFGTQLAWVPILDVMQQNRVRQLEDWSGPLVVNNIGGELFQQVCLAWKDVLSCGPSLLELRGLYRWKWPFEEKERVIHVKDTRLLGKQEFIEVDRDWLVQSLETLADFSAKASSGEYYLLHLLVD